MNPSERMAYPIESRENDILVRDWALALWNIVDKAIIIFLRQ